MPSKRPRGETGASPQERMPFHERIRSLREKQGLSGTELARRAGVRPSYISLIETGRRVPDEAMAAVIARALGDGDAEELYRAWARAHRHGDIEGAVRGLAALRDMLSDAAMTARWARGESLPRAAPPEAYSFRRSVGSYLLGARGRCTPAASRTGTPSRVPCTSRSV